MGSQSPTVYVTPDTTALNEHNINNISNIYSLQSGITHFIYLQINVSHKNFSTFLVDSQADVSILKTSTIKQGTQVNQNQLITIQGVTQGTMRSLGSIRANIILNQYQIPQLFHLVSEHFPIPTDGILGKDFLINNNSILNYPQMNLNLNLSDLIFEIPIYCQTNSFIIPPRCETIRKISINISQPSVILHQEISTGLFIANSIIDSQSSYIRVLNTTDSPITTNFNNLQIKPLSDFDQINADRQNNPFNANRINKLLDIIHKSHTKEHFSKLRTLVTDYADIFSVAGDVPSTNNFYEQKLKLKSDNAVYIKNYRLPYTQKTEINNQVKELLKNNLIEPTISEYNSPIILVPKKSLDGEPKFRLCIDYRAVNKNLIPDKFPLPRMDDILDNLGKAKYFSVIDLSSGFHQIPIHKDSRHVTAFSTENGAFQWKVLPFGLNIAPNSFSRMMNIAFSGLPISTCFLYIDDIIVIGRSVQDHFKNLTTVFNVCRKYNLKINPEKCRFLKPEVVYLGHLCTNHGLLPSNFKLSAVINYPKPHDKESTKRFVAFSNFYRRFIKNFSILAHPLNSLTRKNINFEWNNECEKSFNTMKNSLANPQILAYPDFAKKFIITCDASKIGCGAVLSQIHNNTERPISFASRSFTKGESNKAPIEQELIAVHWAIKHFRPYVYGSSFLVRSDHKPLVYLFSLKDPSSRLTRIRLDLEEYSFELVHIKGTENVVADALSRITIDELKHLATVKIDTLRINKMTTRSMTKQIQPNKKTDSSSNNQDAHHEPHFIEMNNKYITDGIPILNCQILNDDLQGPFINISIHQGKSNIYKFNFKLGNDQSLKKLLSTLEKITTDLQIHKLIMFEDNLLLQWFDRLLFKDFCNKYLKNLKLYGQSIPLRITDPKKQKELIESYHTNSIYGGHCGSRRLYHKLRETFTWKNMSRQIAKYTRSCKTCQLNKPKPKVIEKLRITDTPHSSFEKIILDTMGPLPTSTNGNRYILTIMCDLSKYLVCIPLANKSANSISKALVENIVLVYGSPKQILSDCGTEFLNQVIKELCVLLNIEQIHSAPYRHQTIGTVERNHRVINEYFRSYIVNMENWEDYIKYFMFCYNSTPHSSFDNKFSPFEIIFAKKPNLPQSYYQNNMSPIYNLDNYISEIKYKLEVTNKLARNLLEKNKYLTKARFDLEINPITLNINDKVLLHQEARSKFDPIYKGPFLIKNILNENIEIQNLDDKKSKIVHKNNVVKYIS